MAPRAEGETRAGVEAENRIVLHEMHHFVQAIDSGQATVFEETQTSTNGIEMIQKRERLIGAHTLERGNVDTPCEGEMGGRFDIRLAHLVRLARSVHPSRLVHSIQDHLSPNPALGLVHVPASSVGLGQKAGRQIWAEGRAIVSSHSRRVRLVIVLSAEIWHEAEI